MSTWMTVLSIWLGVQVPLGCFIGRMIRWANGEDGEGTIGANDNLDNRETDTMANPSRRNPYAIEIQFNSKGPWYPLEGKGDMDEALAIASVTQTRVPPGVIIRVRDIRQTREQYTIN